MFKKNKTRPVAPEKIAVAVLMREGYSQAEARKLLGLPAKST